MPRGLIKLWSPYATAPAPQPVQFFNTTVAPDLGRGSVLPSSPLYVDNKPNEDTGDVAIEGTQRVFQDTKHAYVNAHNTAHDIEVPKEPVEFAQVNTLFGGWVVCREGFDWEKVPIQRTIGSVPINYWKVRWVGASFRAPTTVRVSF